MAAARLLVIEDNPANLELMTYLLNAFGYVTETARNGEDGLAKAREGHFDLVICDIQLPKLDGFEVAQGIREVPEEAAVPLVAVTAFAQVGDREKLLAAGFAGYISKPIVPETFVRQIEAYLDEGLRSAGLPHRGGPSGEPAAAPHRRERPAVILVVDNVGHNIDLMRSLLEPFGHQVVSATGVAEAWSCLAGTPPDLAICDLHLGDGTAYELLAAMRESPRLRAVPLVIVSSTGRGPEERERGLALGARRFIVRPIDPPLLLAEINECLGEP